MRMNMQTALTPWLILISDDHTPPAILKLLDQHRLPLVIAWRDFE